MAFFIVFFIIACIISILIYFTEIKIQVSNFEFKLDDKGKNINENFKVIIKFNIFKIINYLRFTINNENLKKYNAEQSLNKIFKQIIREKDNKTRKSTSNKRNLSIEKLNLNIDVGIDDAALTAMVTGIGAIVLSILIGNNVNYSSEVKWNINPVYNNNLLKLDLNCIISIKLIHIIKRIYVMRKEVDKNAGTSIRKNFKYIYE